MDDQGNFKKGLFSGVIINGTKEKDKLYPNLQKEFKNICKERKLARKYIVKEIGIADLTIQKWFNGTRVPSETMQDKVCKYFNKNIEYLFKSC